MQKGLLLIFLFCFQSSFAQRGILFIKKHGYKKVASYAEGQAISFRLKDETLIAGYISLIRNDSIYVNGAGYYRDEIGQIIIRKNDWKSLAKQALITTGSAAALVAVLYLTKKNEEDPYIIPKLAVISYAPFAYRLFRFLRRKHYKVGHKFSLQILDLHFTGKPI